MPRRKKKPQKIQHEPVVARFAARLRELRTARGMSQAQLAEKAQISTNYLSKLEQAGSAAGIDLVSRLASALGVEVAELLPTESPPDDLAVIRDQARTLFAGLIESDDRVTL